MIELLRAQFGTQLDHSASTRLFDTLNWFEMLQRHCFSDAQLHIAHSLAASGNGSVWLPMIDDGQTLRALANWYSFSYAPLFVDAPEANPALRLRLLIQLASSLRGMRPHVTLSPMLGGSCIAEMAMQAFRQAGWIAMATPLGSNHILRLNGRDFAAYWSSRPGALRTAVKRKSRSAPCAFEIHRELSEALWREYLAVYAASWKDPEPTPDLLRAIAQDAQARCGLRLAFARHSDGRAVATQLWTIEGDTALIHKMAHDRSLDRQSPGTLLSHHMFAHVIDHDGVAVIDYGTGDNGYKRQWMEEERIMMRIDFFDPARPVIWPAMIKTSLSRLVERLKER